VPLGGCCNPEIGNLFGEARRFTRSSKLSPDSDHGLINTQYRHPLNRIVEASSLSVSPVPAGGVIPKLSDALKGDM
jgi:hypothetical protein